MTAATCPARLLLASPDRSRSGRWEVAAGEADAEHVEVAPWHVGLVLEVVDDLPADAQPLLAKWTDQHLRAFHRPDALAHGLEPAMCDRLVAGLWPCSRPARHVEGCQPW